MSSRFHATHQLLAGTKYALISHEVAEQLAVPLCCLPEFGLAKRNYCLVDRRRLARQIRREYMSLRYAIELLERSKDGLR